MPVTRGERLKPVLERLLATRRASDELATFVAATVDDEAEVRRAAMAALGQIGTAEQIAQLLPGVLKAEKGSERDDAERNIALICSRIDDESQRGNALIDALKTVDVEQQDQLLSLLGRVGGPRLINYVAEIATGPDASRRRMRVATAARQLSSARPALSLVEPLLTGRDATLVEVTTRTGVRHQVRVHLAAAGYPLFGDDLYGGPAVPGFPGHFLHASRLHWREPGGCRGDARSALPNAWRRALESAGAPPEILALLGPPS